MFFSELHQFREPRHRPIVVQDFTEDARRLESGQARQIDRRLGMPSAAEDAPVLGAKRKDMSGLNQILRRRFRVRDGLDRRRPIVRADSGRHPARRIHRDGEIGPIHLAVLRHHSLEPELFRPFV